MTVTRTLIFQPTYDSNGDRNKIDLSDTLDQAYFLARVNDPDPYTRWYPSPEINEVKDTRGDSVKDTSEDGTDFFVQQGVGSVEAGFWGASQQLVGQLKSLRCNDVSAYCVDMVCGNLVGTIGADQDECDPAYLYPIKINKGSVDPVLMKATGKTVQKVMLKFNWNIEEQDENLRVITRESTNYDLRNLRGLLDICSSYSDITVDGFTATLTVKNYGDLLRPVYDQGLETANFTAYNVTQAATAIIDSVTESSDGVYDMLFRFPQTAGDVIRLTPSMNGRDYTLVIANTFQIPLT